MTTGYCGGMSAGIVGDGINAGLVVDIRVAVVVVSPVL
jgi:hypothetical protein